MVQVLAGSSGGTLAPMPEAVAADAADAVRGGARRRPDHVGRRPPPPRPRAARLHRLDGRAALRRSGAADRGAGRRRRPPPHRRAGGDRGDQGVAADGDGGHARARRARLDDRRHRPRARGRRRGVRIDGMVPVEPPVRVPPLRRHARTGQRRAAGFDRGAPRVGVLPGRRRLTGLRAPRHRHLRDGRSTGRRRSAPAAATPSGPPSSPRWSTRRPTSRPRRPTCASPSCASTSRACASNRRGTGWPCGRRPPTPCTTSGRACRRHAARRWYAANRADVLRRPDHDVIHPRYREDWVGLSDLWLAAQATGAAGAAIDEAADGVRTRRAIMGAKMVDLPMVPDAPRRGGGDGGGGEGRGHGRVRRGRRSDRGGRGADGGRPHPPARPRRPGAAPVPRRHGARAHRPRRQRAARGRVVRTPLPRRHRRCRCTSTPIPTASTTRSAGS